MHLKLRQSSRNCGYGQSVLISVIKVDECSPTLYVSSTFSDSSFSFSISSLSSSISRWAMSHFCSADSFSDLSILLLRDLERFRWVMRAWSSRPDCPLEVLCDMTLWEIPASFGSTRCRYFSNMRVSASRTWLARLKEKWNITLLAYPKQNKTTTTTKNQQHQTC